MQKQITIQQIEPDIVDRGALEYEEVPATAMNASFIPKPSGYQQLPVLPENNTNSCIVAPRGASIGAETRSSPPKTMIGSGIGQGFNFPRGFTLRPAHQGDANRSQGVPDGRPAEASG